MTDLRVGTSGWSYPSGPGSWNGIFYPPAERRGGRGSKVDELAYYAEHFDTVEVNSTFYRQPTGSMSRSWVSRTPASFCFSVKLYQKFTHPEMYGAATGHEAQPAEGDADEFRRGIDPIAAAGKLGALLAQFPPSFRNAGPARDYLGWLLEAFRQYPVAVELRHRSWSDEARSTLSLLNDFGAAWVQIDEPKFRFSIEQDFVPNVRGFFYMRLHGRNAAKWWRHESADERYDYLYSTLELRPFVDHAAMARHIVKRLYVYLNNHFAAKAVANAVQLKHALGLPITGTFPPDFTNRYPELAPLVATSFPTLPLHTSS